MNFTTESLILAFVIFNITLTFAILGYVMSLNNKIARIDTKIESHVGWHRGRESKF